MDKNKQVIQNIRRMVISSQQVLQELPKEKIKALGGESALIVRTKKNITDSLSWSGLADWSYKIEDIDIGQAQKMEDFVSRLSQALNVSFAQ